MLILWVTISHNKLINFKDEKYFKCILKQTSYVKVKALQNWKITDKALSQQLKLTIITKWLIAIIIVSFVNVND